MLMTAQDFIQDPDKILTREAHHARLKLFQPGIAIMWPFT